MKFLILILLIYIIYIEYKNKRFFKCDHLWVKTERSNVLQFDELGYPLRLYICRCSKCNRSEQQWYDVSVEELSELRTGKAVELKWSKLI